MLATDVSPWRGYDAAVVGVVQQVAADLVPCPVDVVGDEHEPSRPRASGSARSRVRGRRRGTPARRPRPGRGVAAWAISPRPNRPARRAAAWLPPPMKNCGPPLVGRRGDLRRAAGPCHRLAADQRRGAWRAVRPPGTAAVQLEPEVVVLLPAVPDAQHVGDPPAADDVEHRDVLGQADRLVEREDRGGHHDPERVGPGGDRRRQDQRRGQVAVLGPVVLGEHGHDGAAGLGPRRHVDRRCVEVVDGGTPGGRPHVEAEGEHRRVGASGAERVPGIVIGISSERSSPGAASTT